MILSVSKKDKPILQQSFGVAHTSVQYAIESLEQLIAIAGAPTKTPEMEAKILEVRKGLGIAEDTKLDYVDYMTSLLATKERIEYYIQKVNNLR